LVRQTATNKTALTAIIATIEQQFNVKFSYAVEDVATMAIENQLLNFEQLCIPQLKVLLNFKALDNRYVTVSVLNKTFPVRHRALRILRFLYRSNYT
jgi:hypothetical protein